MPTLNGITVNIFCNGAPLEEYSTLVDPENPSKASCWIPSQQDQSFSVHYAFESDQETRELGWCCLLCCDGVYVRKSSVLAKQKRKIQKEMEVPGGSRPLLFAPIVETDSQEATSSAPNPLLGAIQVSVRRIKSLPEKRVARRQRREGQEEALLQDLLVHESKKTLGGHRVRLGELRERPEFIARPHFNYTYESNIPTTEFIFYYRPRVMLQALGHAPQLSSLVLGAMKRSESVLELSSEDEEESTRIKQELQELEQRQQQLLARQTTLQHSKRVKHEQEDIIVPHDIDGPIDLTSD